MEGRGARPLCPFEGGGEGAKVNFPDVRNVLPFRGARRRKGGGVVGEGGGSGGDDDGDRSDGYGDENGAERFPSSGGLYGLALEALDVEETRAHELANCTIDVLANTFPVDFDADIDGLHQCARGSGGGGLPSVSGRQLGAPQLLRGGDGGSSDDDGARCTSSSVSSEDELSAALRLAAEVNPKTRNPISVIINPKP
jgi:hypothetical protein